jgi:hypothetical protein
MAADHLTTFLALPRFLLLFQEFLHSMLFDEFQIVYHTHPVTSSVSFINGSQSLAWEAFALVAETDFIL